MGLQVEIDFAAIDEFFEHINRGLQQVDRWLDHWQRAVEQLLQDVFDSMRQMRDGIKADRAGRAFERVDATTDVVQIAQPRRIATEVSQQPRDLDQVVVGFDAEGFELILVVKDFDVVFVVGHLDLRSQI